MDSLARNLTLAALAFSVLSLVGQAFAADGIHGQVLGGGAPIAKSTVTLWEASAVAPKQLAQTKTNDDGRFEVRTKGAHSDAILYLVANGGVPKASKAGTDNPVISLLAVVGSNPPESVTINELTTVASAFTNARFINGDAISGNPLGLKIAAGNVPNLVDPVTGGWGKLLLDPLNSSMTTTMANLDTLGSLITASFTVANDDWRARFYKAATPTGGATPKNTLEAMAGIAREPWTDPKDLYALFDEAYPLPAPDGRRSSPFVPYLVYPPADFALSLAFSGGGDYANGRFMFDADGNLWCGMNWMPGSQSGVNKSTGGGVGKFSPNGVALSPPIFGFTGMGIDGVGWGTAVTKDRVWISSFNGKILVMDFNGKPVADSQHLRLEVASAAPGEKVPVRVWRDGASKTVEVVVNELKEEGSRAKNDSSPSESSDTLQGVGVADLDSQARRQYSVPENVKGAIVNEVDPGSAAAEAGLKPGDVIMEINKHAVKSADEAVKLTTNVKDKTTLLHVWSGDGSHYLVVDESKAG